MTVNSGFSRSHLTSLMLTLAVACGASSSTSTTGASATGTSSTGSSTSATGSSGSSTGSSGSSTGSSGGSTGSGGTTSSGGAVPTVLSTTPVSGATSVPLNQGLSATFSEAMEAASLTPTTFTLTSGSPPVAVAGTVAYASAKAVFWPTALLATATVFTATLTTGAKSASGVPLAASHSWTFTTGTAAIPGVPVDLGTAAGYVILASSGISTVAPSAVTGALGLSPAAATYITGFSLVMDSTNVFSTSAQLTGKAYAADYAPPTPTNLTTAVADMGTAFTAAAGRAPDVTELGAGDISGMTLPAGVYSWSSGLLLSTNVTLTGSGTDVWIFQIAKNLTVANGVQLVLAGGAQAKNVFWQVSGGAALGTTAQLEGTILCQTAITLNTGASLTGRLLAQTAVTLSASTVVAP